MELHKHSLAFSLDDLAALSSTQLALVQFHPEASPLVEERAKVEFVRRRAAWLEREKQRLEAEEKPVVAVKQEEEVDAGVTALAGGASVEDLGAVKKEATEVLTLDDDDDEVEVFTLPKKGKAPKEVRKRKASLYGFPSSASSKRSRAAVIALNPTPTPTPPPPQPNVASILSGLSFRKKKSSASVEADPAVDRGPLPFGLPGAGTTGTPPEPSPKANAAKPVIDFSVDLLHRTTRRQASPPPTNSAPPALIIAPNPLLSRTITHSATVPTDEADRQFVFRPPPSFPLFTPFPPNAAEKGTDLLPTALVDKFITVAINGLSTSVTKELLLRFLYRNQHRLARRPLAIMRSEDIEEEYWEDEEGDYHDFTATFFLAYRSLEDAKLVVEGNNGKMLPDFEEHARTISARLVRGDLPKQPTTEQLQAARQKELDVGWTWDATSEEVRKIWWKARDIPYSRVCPRYDASEADERIISDEYHTEADRILSGTTLVGFVRDLAQYVHEEKEAVYDERRSAWIRWTERSDKEEALAAGEKEPEWPTWPNDAAVMHRATKRLLEGVGRREADRLAEQKRDKQILVPRERLFASRQSTFAPAALPSATTANAITSTSVPTLGLSPWEASSARSGKIIRFGTATAQATSAVPSTPPKAVVSTSAPPPRKSISAFPF
ncbi:hypothetical protein JCM10296v2_003075 [Rhodotorula toruloides]